MKFNPGSSRQFAIAFLLAATSLLCAAANAGDLRATIERYQLDFDVLALCRTEVTANALASGPILAGDVELTLKLTGRAGLHGSRIIDASYSLVNESKQMRCAGILFWLQSSGLQVAEETVKSLELPPSKNSGRITGYAGNAQISFSPRAVEEEARLRVTLEVHPCK